MPTHPLTSDDGLKDAARTTLRTLLTVAKRYGRRRGRLDELFLFAGRSRTKGRTKQVVPKAEVIWDDSPEMELMLKHRDDYERLGVLLEHCHVAMEKAATADPESLKALTTLTFNINRLESQREAHLEAMRELLAQVSRELMTQENVMAKVVAEGAKLAQLAQINVDRIRAALQSKGVGEDSKSNTELQAIARKIQQQIADGTYEPEVEKEP